MWSGHQLQCPACQHELVVPAKAEAAAPAAPANPEATLAGLSKVGTSQPKLSIGGAASHPRPTGSSTPSPQSAVFQANLNRAKAKKNSEWKKWVVWGVAAVALAIGGYFGYGYYTEWQAKRAEAGKAAATPAVATNAAGEPESPKDMPLVPPLWTTNLAEAKIPKGKANGTLAGANFVVENAQFDKGAGTYLLRLEQGQAGSPDRQLKFYLPLGAAESPAGHSWNISPDMKGKGVPQILALWKPSPGAALQQKLYNSGYAMKLELGKIADGAISGKIFLALQDKDLSALGGGV